MPDAKHRKPSCSCLVQRGWLLLLAAVMLSACGGEAYDPTAEWTAKDFYDEAMQALNAGEFQTSIQHLETLEARYPFDPYAKQAQLDVAYSYYKFDEPDTALSAVDRFMRLHPRDKHIDYALYLKGVINFNRGKTLLEDWVPHDHAKHDPTVINSAFNDFNLLLKRFPDSYYAGDAHQRMIFLANKMAEQEILAARYYQERKAWLGVANRAIEVIEKYPRTMWRNEALRLLASAYREMGLLDLAADTERVLQLNTNAPAASDEISGFTPVSPPPSYIDKLFSS